MKTLKQTEARQWLGAEYGPDQKYANDSGYVCQLDCAVKIMEQGQVIHTVDSFDYYCCQAN